MAEKGQTSNRDKKAREAEKEVQENAEKMRERDPDTHATPTELAGGNTTGAGEHSAGPAES